LPKKVGATKTGPTRAGPTGAVPTRAGPTRAVPTKTGLTKTRPTKTSPTKTSPATRFGHSSPLVAPRPNPTTVNKIVPRRGPAGGGNWVVVDGTGLSGARAVYFGTVRAPRLTVVSPTEVKALAPVHSPGTVNVTVTGSGPGSATSGADRYTFNRLQFGPGPVVPPTSAP
jgi:hypothetical protein